MLRLLKKELGEEFSKKKAKNSLMNESARSESTIKDLQNRINRIKQIAKANRMKVRFADDE